MAQDMPAPPEAAAIKLARLAARLGVDEAVAKVKAEGGSVSATYWRNLERGHGGRRGQRVPARASEGLLAQMAYVVSLSPDKLRDAAVDHPDGEVRARTVRQAARVLEEMLRRDGASPSKPEAAPDPAPMTMAQTFDSAVFAARVRERLADLAAQGNSRPDGDSVFDPQGDDPFDLGVFLGGGFADAWDIALERGFAVDAAADLAGRTWAKAAPRWAGRDAGHRISRLARTHDGRVPSGHSCLFATIRSRPAVKCGICTHIKQRPRHTGSKEE